MAFVKIAKLDKRIVFISNQFLGKPYLPGALSEGEEGQFDQNLLYRRDYFDCLTLVNTGIQSVPTLALSSSVRKKDHFL
ncbi:hypothetical protein B1F79_03525 [Coxiella-like endosymbiont of Rhipicephalus sanguineus]|nr:hypothetical protein [Coxiella-like endosymbiont of Rhipicephalus sanguineus]